MKLIDYGIGPHYRRPGVWDNVVGNGQIPIFFMISVAHISLGPILEPSPSFALVEHINDTAMVHNIIRITIFNSGQAHFNILLNLVQKPGTPPGGSNTLTSMVV